MVGGWSVGGLEWTGAECVGDGTGYGGEGLDAGDAEDMSLAHVGDDRYRMYYAACDRDGIGRIASAVTDLAE